jgi:hypothetical protein
MKTRGEARYARALSGLCRNEDLLPGKIWQKLATGGQKLQLPLGIGGTAPAHPDNFSGQQDPMDGWCIRAIDGHVADQRQIVARDAALQEAPAGHLGVDL